jgi:hypothetical protein
VKGSYSFSVRFADTLGHYFAITFLVTGILAIFALISRCVFEEFSTKRTTHNLIELLHDEFVTVYFVHLFFSLTNRSLSAQSTLERTFAMGLLDCQLALFSERCTKIKGKEDLTSRFKSKPSFNALIAELSLE